MNRIVYNMPFTFNIHVMITLIIAPKYLRYTVEASIILFELYNKQLFSFFILIGKIGQLKMIVVK